VRVTWESTWSSRFEISVLCGRKAKSRPGFTTRSAPKPRYLLLSGEADPITPPANAELAAQHLPNSLHLVAPGQGHANIFRGCIPTIAADFIESGSVQGLDTECVQDLEPLPFFLNFSGPTP
jgi:hypothetical protein